MFMIFNCVGDPGEGATVTAVVVAPNVTDWARGEPNSLQETVGVDGEEGTWLQMDYIAQMACIC